MQHITVDGKFDTAQQAIADVLSKMSNKTINERTPVVVATQISTRKTIYGVQYWTPAQIEAGKSVNTDRTSSVFCAK